MPATGATTSQNTPHENKVFSLLCRLFGRGLYSPTLTNGHNAKELGKSGKLQVGYYWVKFEGKWQPALFGGYFKNTLDEIGFEFCNGGSYALFDEVEDIKPMAIPKLD